MIYADNAATTQLDTAVFEAMKPYLLSEYANASEPYHFARAAKLAIRMARETIADCIGALPEEIYFTSCGTESDNWALKGMMLGETKRPELITSAIEHHAILHSCRMLSRFGTEVTYLPVNDRGMIRPSSLETAISEKTKLVSVMMVNNEVGTIQPIEELAAIAHRMGAYFHTDAVQAVGHMPIDVKRLGVDMLSCSGHKFNGPKGIGFLYIRKGLDLPPYMDGGAQEFSRRAGTENVASIAGMAKALSINCEEMEQTEKRLHACETALLGTLEKSGIDFIRNGGGIPGNLSLSFRGMEGEMLLHRLDLMGVCVSTGSACDSKNTKISHVLESMDVPEAYAKGTIRVSLGRYNSVEEAEQIARSLIHIHQQEMKLRK